MGQSFSWGQPKLLLFDHPPWQHNPFIILIIIILITFISPFVSVNSLVFLLLRIRNFHSLFRLVMIPLHSSSSQSVFPLMASLSLLLLLSASCLAMASAYEDSFDAGFPLEAFQKRRGRELFGKRSSGGGAGMERQSRRTRELFGKRAAPAALIESEIINEAADGEEQSQQQSHQQIADLVEFLRAQKRASLNDGDDDVDGEQQQELDRILSLLGHQRARRARGVQRELFGRRRR